MAEIESDKEETDTLIPSEVVEGDSVRPNISFTSRIMGKVVYPLLLAVSFGLVLSDPFVDRYFMHNSSHLTIPATKTTSVSISMPKVAMSASCARISEPGSEVFSDVSYDCDCGPFERGIFGDLESHFIGMRYSLIAHTVVSILGYVSMGLLGAALVIQLVFREFPSTHVFRPQSKISESWKKSVPVWFVFFAALICLVRLLLLTSFVQSLSTRIALYTVRSSSALDWEKFLDQISAPEKNRMFELSVLISLGEWFHKHGAAWSVSTWFLFICLVLTVSLFLSVFYSDIQIAKNSFKPDNLQNQMDNLPSQAKIRPLWISCSFFTLSILATKMVGKVVYNIGRPTNLLPWTTLAFTSSIDDVVLSHTGAFWFEPAFIVDATSSVWIPLVAVIVLGSVARVAMLSKLIEVLAVGYTIRAFSIGVTTMPSSLAVLQTPECYSDKIMTWMDAIKGMEFCNDMMFSGHATLSLTPAFIVIFMLIYGPYKDRAAGITGVASVVLISTAIVITGRFHYTSDVIVSVMICALLALVNAPAWKLLFSFGKWETGIGSKLSMRNAGAILEETGMRIVTITRGRRIDYYNTDWDMIDRKQMQIKYSIEKLKSKLEPLDHQ